MNEKDRILTLVKEGVITSQEALVLLEQLGDKETTKAVDKETKQVDAEELEKKDKEYFNKVIEGFANVASSFSVKMDKNHEGLNQLTQQIKEKEERLEELKTLKSFEDWDVDEQMEAQRLEEELASLSAQKETLIQDKKALEEEMQRLKKEEIQEDIKRAQEKIKTTDWKQATDDSARQLGNSISRFARQVSDFVSKTVESATSNVEWESREVNVPKLATTTFDHTFESPVTEATIVDIKIANGDLKVKTWNETFVKIEGHFKIYGSINGVEPLQALMERSTFEYSEEKIIIHIPNKRVYADLLIYLPEREYDYASVKLLNGDARLKNIKGKDFYIKTTNGDVLLKDVHGTMLEIDTLNGDCKLIDCEFKDLVKKAMNGDTTVQSNIISSTISSVNGDVKMQISSPETKRVSVTSTNGDVVIRLDQQLALEAVLKTSLGDLEFDQQQVEVVSEVKEMTAKKVELKKLAETSLPIDLQVNTTTGDVNLNLV